MKSYLSAFTLVLMLTACATPKTFVATNGSRADGTVELSYVHGPFESPVVNDNETQNTAKQRCEAWGYKNAAPFGGQTESCNAGNCDETIVTTRYQCLGDLK